MDARAFAKGNVVQFAPGQFRPDTEQGRQLIQHELGHVVQQARGGVRADMPGMNLNADEGLEHQADLGGLNAGGGAPMSLGFLNAETAPMQGGFFSSIKNYFKKDKTSHEVGKGMKRRDEVAEQMTAEHEAEQGEIASVMKAQGYSDEEIQAQLMFQRVNMSGRRADPVNRATADFQDLSMGLDSSAEMDNTFARMGHGTLTQSARERQQQRLDHFNRNVLANGDEDQQAEQMAASLGAKYIPDDMNLAKLDTASVPSRAGEQEAHRPFTQAQIDNMENTFKGVRGDGTIEERIAPVTAPMKQEIGDYFDSLDETGFSYGKAAQGIQEYRRGPVGVKYNKSTIATTKKLMEMFSSHVDQPAMQAMLHDVYGHEMQNPEKMGASAHSHADMESRFVKNIMSKGLLPVGSQVRKEVEKGEEGNDARLDFLQKLQSNTAYLESMHDRMGDEDFPEELRELMASYGPLREKILEAGRGKADSLEAPSLPSISLAEGPKIGPMPSAGPALRANVPSAPSAPALADREAAPVSATKKCHFPPK